MQLSNSSQKIQGFHEPPTLGFKKETWGSRHEKTSHLSMCKPRIALMHMVAL